MLKVDSSAFMFVQALQASPQDPHEGSIRLSVSRTFPGTPQTEEGGRVVLQWITALKGCDSARDT